MNLIKLVTLSTLPESLLQKVLNHSRSRENQAQRGKDSTSTKRPLERNAFARLTDWIEISNEELEFLQYTLAFGQVLQTSELSKFILLKRRDQLSDMLVSARKQMWQLETELQKLQLNQEDKFDFTHHEQMKEVKKQLGKFHAQTIVLQESLEAKDSLPNL